jgi:hypothetical protein
MNFQKRTQNQGFAQENGADWAECSDNSIGLVCISFFQVLLHPFQTIATALK